MIHARWEITLDPLPRLAAVKASVAGRVLKKALKEAAQPILADLRANAPYRTGTLRKSFSIKLVAKKNRVTAIIGPRSRFSQTRKGRLQIPNLYVRALEEGNHPFMRATFARHEGQFRQTVTDVVAQEIARILAT